MAHEHTGSGHAREEVLELCLDEFLTELPSEASCEGIDSVPPELPPRTTRVRALRPVVLMPPPPSTRRPAVEQGVPREGDVIGGKYEVNRVLGHNGNEVVVRGRHLDLGLAVVIRSMTAQAALLPGAVQRFQVAAQRALRLHSDQAERILDFGRFADGTPYRVAALPRGPSLSEVLRVRECLPVQEAVDLVLSLSEAVAEAHAHGLVYGNLGSENLFVERRRDHAPRLCFVDFGVVESNLRTDSVLSIKSLQANARRLNAGRCDELALPGVCSMAHALPYLAPEQFRAPASVDHRADLWALGALLYEMLAGQQAFRAENEAELRARISEANVPELATVCRGVAPALAAAVHACLQAEPWLRPQSVLDLTTMLVPFSSRRPARPFDAFRSESGLPAASLSTRRPLVTSTSFDSPPTGASQTSTLSSESGQAAPITLIGYPAPVTVESCTVRERAPKFVRSRVSARTPTFYSLRALESERYALALLAESQFPALLQMPRQLPQSSEPLLSEPVLHQEPPGKASPPWRSLAALSAFVLATLTVSVLAAVGTRRLLDRDVHPSPLPALVARAEAPLQPVARVEFAQPTLTRAVSATRDAHEVERQSVQAAPKLPAPDTRANLFGDIE